MSEFCPYCGYKIYPDSNTAYYDGGVYHASCAVKAQREERDAADDAQRMLQESADRQEQIARESAAIQEQLAREAFWEQQQARVMAEEAEQHAREQKELTQEDILYRNSLDAAKDGDIDSMVYVAKCLLEGKIVTYSESNAKNWLLKAIEGNSYEALTMIYRVWTNLTIDEKKGIISKWILIVGDSSHTTYDSYINFFECLREDRNTKEALAFFKKYKGKMPNVNIEICPQCGEIMIPNTTKWVGELSKRYLDSYPEFCSKECRDNYYKTENGIAETEKAKKIKFKAENEKCAHCGEWFPKNKGWFKTVVKENLNSYSLFCSEKCCDYYYKSEEGKIELEKAEKIKFEKEHIKCEQCGEWYPKGNVVRHKLSKYLRVQHNLCSEKCLKSFYKNAKGKGELKKARKLKKEKLMEKLMQYTFQNYILLPVFFAIISFIVSFFCFKMGLITSDIVRLITASIYFVIASIIILIDDPFYFDEIQGWISFLVPIALSLIGWGIELFLSGNLWAAPVKIFVDLIGMVLFFPLYLNGTFGVTECIIFWEFVIFSVIAIVKDNWQ